MAVIDQEITDRYAIYNGDCIEIMGKFPKDSIHLSIYSPPFRGLYHYSSHERDLSNCDSPEDFMAHYEYVIREIERITLSGRMTAVHCADVPHGNSGNGEDRLIDFPGEIIRLHEKLGFHYIARHCIWKEPLRVRNRTMQKSLAHQTVVEDSTLCGVAGADYLLIFRKKGENKIPVTHPIGLLSYAGERDIPNKNLSFKGYEGKQTENIYSHWIWRQYASSFWDDIRIDRVLPYKESREEDDEKHVHPLQLDVIERVIILRSNPGEIVWTPFMGVGSEVYASVVLGRKGIGAELKTSYYKQALKNLKLTENKSLQSQKLI